MGVGIQSGSLPRRLFCRVPRRVVVIGGGLVGLATAFALLRRHPRFSVTLLEKEAAAGSHQSTHNSGVLHAGLYYTPGSGKARLAVQGLRAMTAFCRQHDVRHEICGKLVVAVNDSEVPRLRVLFARGQANGLSGLRWLSAKAAREIEPHVNCVAAVQVPEEGIADYAGVVNALCHRIADCGGELRTSEEVHALSHRPDGWSVQTDHNELTADFVINCAGLHADRVAALAGEPRRCMIVPFRGEYFRLREGSSLVRNLIYPVPDPALPFLGVHFTRMIAGGIECGPNAVLALSREGYSWRQFNSKDASEALSFSGLWRFIRRNPRVTAYEIVRSFSKSLFTRALQRLVPELCIDDLEAGGSGVRAQAILPNGTLVQDFLFVQRSNVLHVLNAPSPAATASLAIGAEIAEMVASSI